MNWVIASDHAGISLKNAIFKYLTNKNFNITNLGTDLVDTPCDYPDYADKVCKEIINGNAQMGILICGTGIGISIRANRYKGIRAALIHNEFTATSAKEHNNANIICFGERVIDEKTAIICLEKFLSTNFAKGRHQKRIEKLDKTLIK